MEITIEQLKTFSPDITPVLNSLLRQLDLDSKMLGDENVREIVENQSNRFFVARETVNNEIIGMLTLVIYRIPFTKKGILEDVVVDEKYRGKGVGTKLISSAIENARRENVSYLDLTSRPERVAANNLYEHLSFKKRDTNVYRIDL
jgi:ribosomal protein S18 acetylase RimI-like enzyme